MMADRQDTKMTREEYAVQSRRILQYILADQKMLHDMTLLTMTEFESILDWYVAIADNMDDAPLFGENMDRTTEPGNRCKLRYDESLLLFLEFLKSSNTEAVMAVRYGIDQSTISRYIRFSRTVLEKVLPTPDNVNELIKLASKDSLEKFVPDGIVIIDGSHIRTNRSADPETGQARFGRMKKPTANTVIMINKEKLIIGISETLPGSFHDITITKKHMPHLADLASRKRIAIFADKGFVGLGKYFPESHAEVPVKNYGSLTEGQKKDNAAMSSVRIIVEHVIGEMKLYKTVTGPYRGTLEELQQDVRLAAGLVNLKRLGPHKWDSMWLRFLERR